MTMTPSRKSTSRGATAGTLILGGVVLGTLVGWGLGTLLGAVAPCLIVGVFIGLAGGTWAVIVRFRDL
jgi:hypothetical protein